MAAPAAEERIAAPKESGAISEDLALLPQTPSADAAAYDAETRLAKERPTLG
jgi:hypothetical protein